MSSHSVGSYWVYGLESASLISPKNLSKDQESSSFNNEENSFRSVLALQQELLSFDTLYQSFLNEQASINEDGFARTYTSPILSTLSTVSPSFTQSVQVALMQLQGCSSALLGLYHDSGSSGTFDIGVMMISVL